MDPASFSTPGPKKAVLLPARQVLGTPGWPGKRSHGDPLAAGRGGGCPLLPKTLPRTRHVGTSLFPRWRRWWSGRVPLRPRRVPLAGRGGGCRSLSPYWGGVTDGSRVPRAAGASRAPAAVTLLLPPITSGCSIPSPWPCASGDEPPLKNPRARGTPSPPPPSAPPPCPESAGRSHVMYISREVSGVNQCILGEGKFFYLVE